MGHADVKTTMRYVTVTAEQMDDAIGRAFGQQVGNKAREAGSKEAISVDEM
jgi:site-specific recombinase XerD